ncbi:MAG: hypothetical protein CCU26_11755 [Nitrospira sp. UW-LDO-01]|nr:MAG: hypothetical protein CCU26_11755 [Nitrospira sp. UW-LDO-01]
MKYLSCSSSKTISTYGGQVQMKPSRLTLGMVLIAILFLGVGPQVTSAAPVDVDLTKGTWLVSGTDVSGIRWDSSTLTFESQTAQGDNFSLAGQFNWIGSNGSFGRENFTGTLFPNRELALSGFEIVQPAAGIVLANYFAILAESGKEIVNGSWNGSGIPSNDWSATLAPVPLPAGVWLFSAGLIGLAGMARRNCKMSAS